MHTRAHVLDGWMAALSPFSFSSHLLQSLTAFFAHCRPAPAQFGCPHRGTRAELRAHATAEAAAHASLLRAAFDAASAAHAGAEARLADAQRAGDAAAAAAADAVRDIARIAEEARRGRCTQRAYMHGCHACNICF
jgi:hypothetical protein